MWCKDQNTSKRRVFKGFQYQQLAHRHFYHFFLTHHTLLKHQIKILLNKDARLQTSNYFSHLTDILTANWECSRNSQYRKTLVRNRFHSVDMANPSDGQKMVPDKICDAIEIDGARIFSKS